VNATFEKEQSKLGLGKKTCFVKRHLRWRRLGYQYFTCEGSLLIQRGNAWQSQWRSHKHLLLTQTCLWQELPNCSR